MDHDKDSSAMRSALAAGLLALAALLAACGGSSDGPRAGAPGVLLQVDTHVDGVLVGDPVLAGREVAAAIHPGQSIAFDANEPVVWRFSVNGGELFASGATVTAGGVSITQTTLAPLRVSIATAAVGPTTLPIAVTLTAVSVRDSTQFATVQLQVR